MPYNECNLVCEFCAKRVNMLSHFQQQSSSLIQQQVHKMQALAQTFHHQTYQKYYLLQQTNEDVNHTHKQVDTR